jgi:hypothetical protein
MYVILRYTTVVPVYYVPGGTGTVPLTPGRACGARDVRSGPFPGVGTEYYMYPVHWDNQHNATNLFHEITRKLLFVLVLTD